MNPFFPFDPVRDSPRDEARAPDFAPVPLARSRRDGWTPERQRAFIAALAETGVVGRAARIVGMGVTSAYNLRRRPGAESFARAWDKAEDEARARALTYALDHAINGAMHPRFYRGRFVGLTRRTETGMVIAALRAGWASTLRPK